MQNNKNQPFRAERSLGVCPTLIDDNTKKAMGYFTKTG